MRRFTMVGGLGAAGMASVGLAFTALGAGCSDPKNSTDLHPEGPPEILQVFVVESGKSSLAFGSHPDLPDDDGVVTNASARSKQKIRIVFDELLRGNNLEEIACADGSWSKVPVGTTPDDIAKCSGSPEEIAGKCTAVCQSADGPIGILDEVGSAGIAEPDGAVDDTRMIAGVVTITCDGTEIPWDQQQSFWQPSGNQQITAGPLGVDSLGPAIIIVPTQGLRAGATCTIDMDPSVVDKDDIRPCASKGGTCTPGDFSAISWTVEGLNVVGTDPRQDQTNVKLTANGSTDANALIQFNAAIDEATVASAVTVADESATFPLCADNGDTPPCTTATLNQADPTLVNIVIKGGYTPNNMHTITVDTTIADIFGGNLAQDYTLTFTTADVTPTPDAGPQPDSAPAADAGVDAM